MGDQAVSHSSPVLAQGLIRSTFYLSMKFDLQLFSSIIPQLFKFVT